MIFKINFQLRESWLVDVEKILGMTHAGKAKMVDTNGDRFAKKLWGYEQNFVNFLSFFLQRTNFHNLIMKKPR